MAKKIFISYDYENDKKHKNLLVAWDANDLFDFNFYDGSVTVAVDSTDASAIKRVISARINACPYFLCLIGEETHESEWVAWEIEKAVELGKNIIAVKIKSTNTSPAAIIGVGAEWVMSFTFDAIKAAVDQA